MNKDKLEALQRLATDRYGGRVAFKGEAFIIDGVRLFLTGKDWRELCPNGLLEKLGSLLEQEQAARKVSETG